MFLVGCFCFYCAFFFSGVLGVGASFLYLVLVLLVGCLVVWWALCCSCVVFVCFLLVGVGCVALSEVLLVVGWSRCWFVFCFVCVVVVGVSSWWWFVLCWFVRVFVLVVYCWSIGVFARAWFLLVLFCSCCFYF